MKNQELYWKEKYEKLRAALIDLGQELEKRNSSQERWCELTPEIYVSYDLEASQIESTAKKLYKKYDVYKFSHSVEED